MYARMSTDQAENNNKVEFKTEVRYIVYIIVFYFNVSVQMKCKYIIPNLFSRILHVKDFWLLKASEQSRN